MYLFSKKNEKNIIRILYMNKNYHEALKLT